MGHVLVVVVILLAVELVAPVSYVFGADATIIVGGHPQIIVINPAETFAYVPNRGSGTVSRINLATNTVDARIKVGSGPKGVAINPTGTFAYVLNDQFGISRIDLATNAVDATTIVDGFPNGVAINPAGTFAYVTNESSGTVSKINLTTTRRVVSTMKSTSVKTIATWADLNVPEGATLSLRIEPSSTKYCKISGPALIGLKVGGPCSVTVVVKPKIGKSESETIRLAVVK